jgi:hypothetical protein
MLLKKINISRKINFFFLFIIFYAIFYLYLKHNVGNDTSISEWLINYNGGFTRRGLGGEIAIFIANIFDLPLRRSIFFLQTVLHFTYIILLFIYMRNLKLDIFQIFAFFSPLFLIYPIAEVEVLGRKEILLLIFFVVLIFFSEKKFSPKLINISIFLIFPLICLIWEQVVWFAPFFVVLIIIKNDLNTLKQSFAYSFVIFLPSIITMLLMFLNPLDIEGHKLMCEFLKVEFNERCYMSANLLIKNTIYFDTLHIHQTAKFFPHYFRYILIFIVGFSFLYLCLNQNNFINDRNFISNYFKPIYLFFLLCLPVIPLFIYGLDWGRWINILYSLSILLYLFLIKNKLITREIIIQNFFIQKIINTKYLLIFFFFIFAFFWNPKTVITGDIATNSLYKIIYKSSKIIFNHDGIRLNEDNFLIKFHKKYIE